MYDISDPTLTGMTENEKNTFVACYAVYLSDGNTIKNQIIKKDTLKLYLEVVEEMTGVQTKSSSMNPKAVTFGSMKPPVSEKIANVIKEHGKWDKVEKKREPISPAMLDQFREWAERDGSDSFHGALIDWLTIGFQAGFRKSEWLHDDTRPTKHGTPFHLNKDGSVVPFIADDFKAVIYQEPKKKKFKTLKKVHDPNYLRIRWRFQKNGDNGQMISFSKNHKCEKCPLAAANRILARAKRLRVPEHFPISVFEENGEPVYMTGRMVQEAIRKCAKTVYDITDEELLSRYTCHALRVAAAVTLHCGGSTEHTIMMRLRWKSGAFRGYLRNTPKLAADHNKIVNDVDMDDMDIYDLSHEFQNL